MFQRSAGVLLHPTSLPSRFGIGDLGDAAYQFVDFLAAAKQTLWQVLPLGPTGYGDSPYQCFSAFAGNPMLVTPQRLVRDGYLPAEAISNVPPFPNSHVDFGWVIPYKTDLLRQAFAHYRNHGTAEQRKAFSHFEAEHAWWLTDYSLFMALKNHFAEQSGGTWNTWPEDIRFRQPQAMAHWQKELAAEIELQKFMQFLFFNQWLDLKKYANDRNIQIIGDIPIFAAFDSADVWANQALFHLDETGAPTVIAGVPPDYFSETGQRWGNPLYRWDKMAANNYSWWLSRVTHSLLQADIVRIDHFRGFEAYWEIPAAEPTAVNGQWVKGPGADLFMTFEKELGQLPIIAEDLGVITEGVEALRDGFNLPGMKILQFAFGGERNSDFLPHSFTPNCVVYTGSHDNNTTLGWYLSASSQEQDHLRRYAASDGHDAVWDLIRLAHASVARLAVIPMQDLLVLGEEARMNFPGKSGGLWAWRYTPDMVPNWLVSRLREMTELYGRAPEQQAD